MSYGEGYMWAYLREKRAREAAERETRDRESRKKSKAYLAGYTDGRDAAVRVLKEAWRPGEKNSLSELVDRIRELPADPWGDAGSGNG